MENAPKFKGAQFDKKTGKWKAVITVNKKRINLGTFDNPKDASDAYFAAKAVYTDPYHGKRLREADTGVKEVFGSADAKPKKAKSKTSAADVPASGDGGAAGGAGAAPADAADAADDGAADSEDELDFAGRAAAAGPPRTTSSYIGVMRDDPEANWEAVITVNGQEISGGEYESETEAAKAYDALARMYQGADAKTNFPIDSNTSWLPPDEVVHVGQIDVKPGVPLTVAEIEAALKQERGIDVRTIDLAGKTDIAEHMVFVTGRDARHMGRMADMLSRALRKRKISGVDPAVEARDMDDWMVVDAGNIIVNVMDAEARECFDLENFYLNMKAGVDPWAGMTYDEWLEANPIPEKWLRRIEKDEEEIAAAQRMKALGGGLPKQRKKKRTTRGGSV